MGKDPSDPVSPALERLLSRHAESVRRAGRRYGLSSADVDEVFQDVRIRLWRARETGARIEATSSSYLYRTIKSATLDLIRRRRGRGEAALEAEGAAAAIEPSPPADRLMEDAELAARVAEAVDALAESRQVVVRLYLAGYRQGEIEELLGWPEAKTRSLLYRGLADLRARLEEQGIGPGGDR